MSKPIIDQKDNGASAEEIVVKWTNENYGYIISKYSESLCYKPIYSIKCAIYEYCRDLVNSPVKWKKNEPCTSYTQTTLGISYPRFSSSCLNKITDSIKSIVPKKLDEAIIKYDIKDPIISNFIFLALLGKKRNWKEGCAICLTDKIMGTTCTCGHTEIVIFRPCGHSICAMPCFVDFMKSKNTEIKQKTINLNGTQYIMPTVAEVDLDCCFACPLCTQEVTSTFRAEDARVDSELINAKQLASEIMDSIYIYT